MSLETIDARTTQEWIKTGKAVLIDVREPDEWIKEHIPEAHLVPLSGFNGWRDAGLAVNENAKAPISIMRQVQITAGSLVLLGLVLAVLINPWFAALSAFVGAGLTQAGITGTCAMASLLKHMPWNRVISGQQAVADPALI